jgi:hypothetical protein
MSASGDILRIEDLNEMGLTLDAARRLPVPQYGGAEGPFWLLGDLAPWIAGEEGSA